jgi:hypothetical protein
LLVAGIGAAASLAQGIACGQQVPDAAFKVTVDEPAYVDKHPKVLFDEAHFNVHTSQGTYKALVDLMTSDGYKVDVNAKPFDASVLAGYDVLITSNARGAALRSEKPAFTDAECDAVRDWVQAGGALLLVLDHYPTGHAAENLAKRFEVVLTKGTTSDRASAPPGTGGGGAIAFSRTNKLLGDHAITRGRSEGERINQVVTFTGGSLKGPPGSTALLILSDTAIDTMVSDNPTGTPPAAPAAGPAGGRRRRVSAVADAPQVSAAGKAQGVALKFGKGRVVVLGEASELSAQRAGPGQRAMGMNYPDCDNRQWAVNILHWLTGLSD